MLTINLLSERERQRLYSLATVRGYRIQTNNRAGTHRIVRLGFTTPTGRTPSESVSRDFKTKKEARVALLDLMIAQTRRPAA